ncbi:TPA: type I toxin-antitoxin system toxin HokA [Escherichia coli]|nr:type I toxin-antitoxin system toxin HokA [Escherichia coli]EEX5264809.1 type I toxin-antitoxin system toxin HokA [Escherichia coli O157]EEX6975311.1 type I toxin-antitoxin system toxin HokA [Escherichia coli O157]EEX6985121.1 type I toxin-antitoxin system toxin HokA [Escherichia coli O157]EEX6988985.1 type I toxin-antitoxin system toxin HokA [Escherichia coli O157]
MPQKYRLLSLIVICFTLLFFTWMIRDSLCELHIKQGSYELAAFLACNLKELESSAESYSRLFYGVAHSHCTQIYFSQK